MSGCRWSRRNENQSLSRLVVERNLWPPGPRSKRLPQGLRLICPGSYVSHSYFLLCIVWCYIHQSCCFGMVLEVVVRCHVALPGLFLSSTSQSAAPPSGSHLSPVLLLSSVPQKAGCEMQKLGLSFSTSATDDSSFSGSARSTPA